MKKNIFIGIISLILAFSFIACEEEEEPEAEDTFLGFKLTVTGIPAGTDITAAVLMDPNSANPQQPVVLAAGFNDGGVFKLHHPLSNYQPDFTKPFKTEGSYLINLVKITNLQATPIVPAGLWTKMNGQSPATVQFSGDETMAFTDFTDITASLAGMGQP